ncbi:MAG: DUF262 domain-containing protein, partial [Hymenobacteraceae bacterium]|nr:DUF262 domain-containing protein [Hymenobacteraceae bacterium]
MQLQAQTTLKRLFADPDVTFAVPSFQRAYSWEKDKQVQQFITDLRDQPKKKPYFLGHFLFEQEQLNGNHFLVIDGQQRLTTAVLFFSALCKELEKRMSSGEEINDSDGQPIDLSEVRNIFLQRRGKQKLTAVANDNPFFQAAFLQQQDNRKPSLDSRSQKRMAGAYSLFAETMSLTGNSKGLTTSELLHWKQLLENSVITTFVVTDKVQATQLFAFQNDRGKDLTTLEKLKAFLMYRAYLADDTTNDNKTLSLVEGYFAQIYTISERLRMLKEDQVLSHHNIAFGSTWENAFDNAKDGVIKAGSDAVTWVINYCEALHRTFQEVE